MDAGPDQVFLAGYTQSAVASAGRQQYRPRAVFVPGLGCDHLVIVVGLDLGDRLGRENLHIEPLGMRPHLVGKLSAADALHEARVVVDAFGRPGLAADATLLDDQSLDPLSGGV